MQINFTLISSFNKKDFIIIINIKLINTPQNNDFANSWSKPLKKPAVRSS